MQRRKCNREPSPRVPAPLKISFAGLILLAALLTMRADGFVIGISRPTNGNVRIYWDAPGGSNYVVQVATELSTDNPTAFQDLSGVITIPGPGVQPTNYVHVGGLTNGSAFYRVRSFPAPPPVRLEIQPTNAVIDAGMIARYKVWLLEPGRVPMDVTAQVSFASMDPGSATVDAGTAGGFLVVRGIARGQGKARLQASYQGWTDQVDLRLARLTSVYFDPLLTSVSSFARGAGSQLKLFGIFDLGGAALTNNITASSTLFDAYSIERLEYRVQADVANAVALISGLSAAGPYTVRFGVETLDQQFDNPEISLLWCEYESVSIEPQLTQIRAGQTVRFTVVGHRADGFDEAPAQDSRLLSDYSNLSVTEVFDLSL